MVPDASTLATIVSGYRGPFVLHVVRPASKPGFSRCEWRKGESTRDEVADEAALVLDDPRDTVIGVGIWSTREGQFVAYARRD